MTRGAISRRSVLLGAGAGAAGLAGGYSLAGPEAIAGAEPTAADIGVLQGHE